MSRKQTLYRELARRGGRVANQAAWRELGQSCGYSAHHDLAGYYGGRRPSLARLADGSREFTPDGWRRANGASPRALASSIRLELVQEALSRPAGAQYLQPFRDT